MSYCWSLEKKELVLSLARGKKEFRKTAVLLTKGFLWRKELIVGFDIFVIFKNMIISSSLGGQKKNATFLRL